MLFNLPNNTECELTSFTGRTQKSGPEDVPAVSIRLKLSSVGNALLDLFSPTIRLTAYSPVEGQDLLPGVEPTTPILRSKDLKHWAPETRLEGWRVIVARGITDDGALQMGSCKLDDFHFDLHDGGHIDVDFRVSTADVDEAGAGMLWGRQKRKVFVMITAPEAPTAKPRIDGSVEAFKRDHPEFQDGANPDAGDLFAGQHGEDAGAGDDAASDQHAGDFGTADDTGAPGAGDSDEPNWPEPGADGAAAASDDAADFEAGAAAAIEKATGGRRGRKTRAVVE